MSPYLYFYFEVWHTFSALTKLGFGGGVGNGKFTTLSIYIDFMERMTPEEKLVNKIRRSWLITIQFHSLPSIGIRLISGTENCGK